MAHYLETNTFKVYEEEHNVSMPDGNGTGSTGSTGGITQDMLNQIKSSYKHTPADKAIYNAMAETSIAVLAKNHENLANFDTNFTNKVVSHGITDQQQSGRCWLFTGLNVLRAQMMAKYGLDEMEFSQNYCFSTTS